MPGQTDNSNLLDAINQVIVALNEMTTGLAGITMISTRLTATNTALNSIDGTLAACCSGMQAKLDLVINAITNIRLQPPGGSIV